MRLLESGRPRKEADLAGILLHGRNRTPDEMIQLASRFDLDRARWLAPRADNGSWYPNRFMEPVASNEPFLSQAIDECDRAVDEVSEGGRLTADRIVIVGFSQGACLAIEYALRRPGRSQALVVFTGALIGPPGMVWPASATLLAGTRVLLTGSDIDEWVPEERVRETAKVLADLGAEVHLRIYRDRPHVVSAEEIDEARRFILNL